MGFMAYDLTFLVVFCILLFIFLYRKRQNLKREGIIYLYKTSIGLKIMDYIGKKYKNTLNILQYVSISCGYILMVSMTYYLFKLVYIFAKYPEVVKAIKVPPLMPLIPYLPSIFKLDFLPPFYFTYWIIVIAIIAVGHEFAHGIFARFYNIRVKSTGFGFLGPFLAAFVEPDEKQMKKKGIKAQLSILSAGTFANILLTLIFLIIFALFFKLAFVPSGVIFSTYTYTVISPLEISKIGNFSLDALNDEKKLLFLNNFPAEKNNEKTLSFNGKNFTLIRIKAGEKFFLLEASTLKNLSQEIIVFIDAPAINSGLRGVITEFNNIQIKRYNDFKKEIEKYKPGEKVIIKTLYKNKEETYEIILIENPQDKGKPYLGIGISQVKPSGLLKQVYSLILFFKDPSVYYKPKIDGLTIFIYNLLWWIVLINFSVALVNMLPLGLFDGGRFFYLTILGITRSENIAKKAFKLMTFLLLFLLFLSMAFWFIGIR